jgi:hypothetical protein
LTSTLTADFRALRSHRQTLEILPQMLAGILFNGIAFPRLSAAFGALWILGRLCAAFDRRTARSSRRWHASAHPFWIGSGYTYGYNKGNPQSRYSFGGPLHLLGWIGTWGLSTYISCLGVYALL